MRVLSHRGYWLTSSEKNSRAAFERSFSLGFGTETDIRDLGQDIVISHDSPTQDSMRLEEFLRLVRDHSPELPVALNVKADGLQARTLSALQTVGIKDAFVFDMSIPDSLHWLRIGVPVYTRQSEHEPVPALYDRAAGVWLDSFSTEWWTPDTVLRHLDAGKGVCIVSPELHGRDHRPAWDKLFRSDAARHPQLTLCTDIPEAARDLLHG